RVDEVAQVDEAGAAAVGVADVALQRDLGRAVTPGPSPGHPGQGPAELVAPEPVEGGELPDGGQLVAQVGQEAGDGRLGRRAVGHLQAVADEPVDLIAAGGDTVDEPVQG